MTGEARRAHFNSCLPDVALLVFVPVVSRLLNVPASRANSRLAVVVAFRGLPRTTIGQRYSQRRRRDAAYSCLSAILLLSRTFLEVPRLRPNLLRELDPPRVVFFAIQRYQTAHTSFSRFTLYFLLFPPIFTLSFSFVKNSSVIELMGNTLAFRE